MRGQERAASHLAPIGKVNETGLIRRLRHLLGRLAAGGLRWRQGKAAGPCEADAGARHRDRQIVGIGRDHQTARGGQGGELGINALFQHGIAAGARNDGEDIAGGRIGQGNVFVGARQEGGERGVLGIVLFAGKTNADRRDAGLVADHHFQVGAIVQRGNQRRRFERNAQDGNAGA